MTIGRAALIALYILGASHVAAAQQPSVDVQRLPVDLKKITRDLRQSAATDAQHNGLHIRYTVDVYGQAPRIELFSRQDNLVNGPVPYGAPSHQEMIEHVTPIEYRAPSADLGNLIQWLKGKTDKK
jgi:hypothetical protein